VQLKAPVAGPEGEEMGVDVHHYVSWLVCKTIPSAARLTWRDPTCDHTSPRMPEAVFKKRRRKAISPLMVLFIQL